MKSSFVIVLFLFLSISVQSFTQNRKEEYSVLFYNVENLFDLKDDPKTQDEEFTPEGDRYWTYKRFNQKLLNISKVILNAAGWEPPQMIGLCEVENRFVLERLLTDTPLNKYPYKIIHKESPDERGIDVAFLYNDEIFYPLEYQYFPLKIDQDSVLETREILYVSGVVEETDTLHFFITHWPSRYGGLMETRSLRNLAAKILRQLYRQKLQEYENAKIIIMGDFNDQPDDESIAEYLKAVEFSENTANEDIVNLSVNWGEEGWGTIKYRSQWSVFDQIMVSGTLLKSRDGIATQPDLAEMVKLPFLLETDERYGGRKVNRTYIGYSYNGGFSDHLPILLRLKSNH
ncbi:MAG: endonuclease/exonuclease/phosphatase family protein [Bacteroidota bacterium]